MTAPSTGGDADRLGADLHRAMLDSALEAIVGMDATGVITEFNPAAERSSATRGPRRLASGWRT